MAPIMTTLSCLYLYFSHFNSEPLQFKIFKDPEAPKSCVRICISSNTKAQVRHTAGLFV